MTQLSIEDKKYQECQPLSALNDNSPIEFFIPVDGEKYLDLNDAMLHLRVKITERDGTDIPPNAGVALINYPLNTIFSQCDVILGDRLISQSSATHPYRAMIETLLNFSEDTLKSQFSAGLFYKDTAGAMDSIVINNGPNKGIQQRAVFTGESREVDLLGPLHADIFFCEWLLLNSVCLLPDGDSRFAVCSENNFGLSGMVHHDAFTRRRDLSPFNFRHNDVEYLALCQEGRQVPAKAFQPQFDHGNSVREFYHMFSATGRHLKDLPLSIDRREFNEGYALFAFNLEPSEDADALSPVSNGNLRLEMRFRVPLPQTTTLIVYACYNSILEIDSKRQVLVDYY
ncbi:unnamed protein product [Oreochromis niloticus]|nr:unnamed protein product [Mustela putorius furo]